MLKLQKVTGLKKPVQLISKEVYVDVENWHYYVRQDMGNNTVGYFRVIFEGLGWTYDAIPYYPDQVKILA
jgi:hypothetical protein